MKEITGNIWDYHDNGQWIVVPTNGSVRNDGACVMGRGIALQAARRFLALPYELGQRLAARGNRVYFFPDYRLLTFPVRHIWSERAELHLIEESTHSLYILVSSAMPKLEVVYLPRVGCGNGRLLWQDVKPVLEQYLDDRFVVVEVTQ